MTKEGEINYLNRLGIEGIVHAFNKPYSDECCDYHLIEIGVIMSLLPNSPARLLDIGCGTGWTSCFFAKRGYQVTGQDISAAMIKCANIKKDTEGLTNLDFITGDFEQMSFENEFDCAVFYDSLHHSENVEEALAHAYKALRDDGVLIICEPGKGHSKTRESIHAIDKFHVSEIDLPPGKVIDIGKSAGFRKYSIFPRPVHLCRAVYTYPKGSGLKIFFKFTIVRVVAAIYLMLLHKRNVGIVRMVK